jgi:flagellin-like protein
VGGCDQAVKVDITAVTRRRKAVSGIIATVITFTMVFTIIVGYFVFVNTGVFNSLQAAQQRNQAVNQAAQEKLSARVGLAAAGNLTLRVSNLGEVPTTIIDVFITNAALDKIVSCSVVNPGPPCSQYLGARRDLNFSLPLTILPGVSTNSMSGCGVKPGCDIGIAKQAYTYTAGTPVVVSLLTSSGNVFSAEYPAPSTIMTLTSTSVFSTSSVSTVSQGNPGGNVLVVQMKATPPQTFSCSHCVNDTVTVLNYGTSAVTGVALSPTVPIIDSTGSLTLTSKGCVLHGGSTTILGYSGVGVPPSIVYVCTFAANPNGFGGFASFTGAATGTYNSLPVTSAEAISNTIQIGGPISVLNQGPFSGNFFYFKYSACTNMPTHTTHCTTVPNPLTVGTLPMASSITGSTSYYVAFYLQVTNNFNTTIPILPYTYFMTDPTVGGESPFFLVGNPSSLPYLPNYACTSGCTNNVPALTPYPSSCTAQATSTCINLAPGATVTLTFAACDIGSTWWDWAGSAYGKSFDSGNTCTTNPPDYQSNEATYLTILVSFVYKGQVYTQDIPFVGQKVN